MSNVIGGYAPIGVDDGQWMSVAAEVRRWVTDAQPGHRRRALHLLHACAHLAVWCTGQAIPIGATTTLRDSTIERFCALAERDGRFSDATRNTIRARLRYVARHQEVPGNRPASPRIRHRAVKPPYSAAEIALLEVFAATQGSPLRRQRMLALLHLGLGAGCSATDLRHVRGVNVVDGDHDALVVQIGGTRPRDVVVLDDHVVPLRRLAAAAGDELMIGGNPHRRAVTGNLLARTDQAHGGPELEVSRLRSTWLVRHLAAGTRLDVLVAAAGLSTLASLEDLLPNLAAPDAGDVARELRGA